MPSGRTFAICCLPVDKREKGAGMKGIKVYWSTVSLFFLVFSYCSDVLAMELQKSDKTWSGSLEIGSTVDGSSVARAVGSWWLPKQMLVGENGNFAARIEIDMGVLDTRDTTFDMGFQPVLRYSYDRYEISPYLDLGAGIHFLSRANIRGRQLGGAFQFSVLAGTGVCFYKKWDIGYRFFHISNADIHDNNDGRDEHLVVLTWHF